jgi:uncharacterized surface protein with fasciclin (FAS1) repeats
MIKKLLAGTLLASLALATIAPVGASAAIEGRGQVASDANGVTRLVNFSANNDDRLSTLITAATCPAFNGSIVNLLQTTPAATLFAPDNKAFRDLGQALIGAPVNSSNVCSVDAVLKSPGALGKILSHHVLAGSKITYATAKSLRPAKITMLDGEPTILRGTKNRVIIDSTNVIVKNIRSANLQIHVIDGVMIPPSIAKALSS